MRAGCRRAEGWLGPQLPAHPGVRGAARGRRNLIASDVGRGRFSGDLCGGGLLFGGQIIEYAKPTTGLVRFRERERPVAVSTHANCGAFGGRGGSSFAEFRHVSS